MVSQRRNTGPTGPRFADAPVTPVKPTHVAPTDARAQLGPGALDRCPGPTGPRIPSKSRGPAAGRADQKRQGRP
eukprot:2522933-Prymnesium_polylepis.1